MKAFVGKKMGIILLSCVLMSLCAQTGFAVDELSLVGVIKSADKSNGTITVNIISESCSGLRTLRVPDIWKGDLDDSLVGVKLGFMINSSKCEKGAIYNIIIKEKP